MEVLPALKTIAGCREARVLRRDREFLVVTFWVEPEARAVLREYDDEVRHYEVER